MLRYFFEKSEQDNSYLFDGLKIANAGERYAAYRGAYLVISISLKGLGQVNYEDTFYELKNLIAGEIWWHKDLLQADSLMPSARKKLERICNDEAPDNVYHTALKLLYDCLYNAYGRKVIVLIDEYDVPLQSGYKFGYYEKMLQLIRTVFESILKINDSLEFAVLTRCLRRL